MESLNLADELQDVIEENASNGNSIDGSTKPCSVPLSMIPLPPAVVEESRHYHENLAGGVSPPSDRGDPDYIPPTPVSAEDLQTGEVYLQIAKMYR